MGVRLGVRCKSVILIRQEEEFELSFERGKACNGMYDRNTVKQFIPNFRSLVNEGLLKYSPRMSFWTGSIVVTGKIGMMTLKLM